MKFAPGEECEKRFLIGSPVEGSVAFDLSPLGRSYVSISQSGWLGR